MTTEKRAATIVKQVAPWHVATEVAGLAEEIVANRRFFHRHPELGFQEVVTAGAVAKMLREYGVEEVWEGVATTGVVAVIRGRGSGKCVALRADMDGLPIAECKETREYHSLHDGVMHACGHDGHMAILLAVAKTLARRRSEFSGSVKMLFQPAEEGGGGAAAMIREGVLEEGRFGPRVDVVYGLHLQSHVPLGFVECSAGPVMAASDDFTITVRGKGGHGAAPHLAVDAVVESAALVTSLQTVVSRSKNPLDTGVLTVGQINGGVARNVIADTVTMTGTVRTFSPHTQRVIKSRMHACCAGVAATFGGEIHLDYQEGYPATVNSYPEHVDIVRRAAAAVVGEDRTRRRQLVMGSEDFSYLLQQRPGAFFFVGAAIAGKSTPHHQRAFDFHEDSLLIGASVFWHILKAYLHDL